MAQVDSEVTVIYYMWQAAAQWHRNRVVVTAKGSEEGRACPKLRSNVCYASAQPVHLYIHGYVTIAQGNAD